MKVYQYSRISTSQQSLAQQQLKVRDFLTAKGLELTATIEEEGVSGYKKSYKERRLTELLDMMQEGDCLIVSELSRLCRKMADMSKLIDEDLKPRKLRLIIVSMGIDLQCDQMRAIDELIINNIAFAAQCEAEFLHDRTISGIKAVKKIAKEKSDNGETWVNRKGEVCVGDYNAQYGKHTNRTRQSVMREAQKARVANQKEEARNNPNNRNFLQALKHWEKKNGHLGSNGNIEGFVEELNAHGNKTATGLEFTKPRALAMLKKVRELYDYYYAS